MGSWPSITGFLGSSRQALFTRSFRSRLLLATGLTLVTLLFAAIFYSRQTVLAASPQAYLYLEVGGTLLCYCYAANALVRFRGTHDRTALILSFGFALSGIIETIGYFGFNDSLNAGTLVISKVPLGWMVSRTLLAVLLLAALAVERYMPTARKPSKETAAVLLVVALAAYLTSAAFLAAPAAPVADAKNILSRPWDLLPAALYLVAAVCFGQRIKNDKDKKSNASLFDYALLMVASLNAICHVSAAFSRQLFDGPFFLAELLDTWLFEQVRSMAVSDPLTGLANYRRLISVLEAELDRSRRTQRPFCVLLLDMDGLKLINDQYGHLTGSRALVRIGKVLRSHSRAIDTPARYGGDEFALVLPEAGKDIATRVVTRIRERLAAEAEAPALSVSAGVAAFPEDGDTPEKLLAAADRALYIMKHGGRSSVQNLARIAACL